ncbi:MAG: helix-turn-helix transcriptional regulator [Butyricicoccus porcorum]|nr:helix-turn-helix transcriptional regulator [Butyricicoccus porcorum]
MNSVKTRRCELNMTQTQLARAANISQAAISKIESGTSDPSLALAKILAHILNCTVDELFP